VIRALSLIRRLAQHYLVRLFSLHLGSPTKTVFQTSCSVSQTQKYFLLHLEISQNVMLNLIIKSAGHQLV
jgi:hypothetical protein